MDAQTQTTLPVWWPVVSFAFGAVFGLFLQWLSHRLALRREMAKEYWIRKLNSYQNFYQYVTQLLDLLLSGVSLPEEILWQSISEARKAAYDASFYDVAHRDRTERMIDITRRLVQLHSVRDEDEKLRNLRQNVQEIYREFRYEEGI